MNLQELLEHAHLDALGYLEGPELAAFEEAFAAAPAAVKAQIRAEQARWARADSILPAVEAPAELRDRVLDAVSGAMLESQIAAQETAVAPGRVASGWRTSSIALITAVVILGAAFFSVYRTNIGLNNQLQDDRLLTRMLTTMGSNYMGDALFNQDTRRIVFEAPEGSSFEGQASIWVSPNWQKSRFFGTDLPAVEGENYRVVELDSTGTKVVNELRMFSSNESLIGFELPRLRQGAVIALVSAAVDSKASADRLLLVARV